MSANIHVFIDTATNTSKISYNLNEGAAPQHLKSY